MIAPGTHGHWRRACPRWARRGAPHITAPGPYASTCEWCGRVKAAGAVGWQGRFAIPSPRLPFRPARYRQPGRRLQPPPMPGIRHLSHAVAWLLLVVHVSQCFATLLSDAGSLALIEAVEVASRQLLPRSMHADSRSRATPEGSRQL